MIDFAPICTYVPDKGDIDIKTLNEYFVFSYYLTIKCHKLLKLMACGHTYYVYQVLYYFDDATVRRISLDA